MARCIEEDVFRFEVTFVDKPQSKKEKTERRNLTDTQYYTCANAPMPKSTRQHRTLPSPHGTSSPSANAKTTLHHS